MNSKQQIRDEGNQNGNQISEMFLQKHNKKKKSDFITERTMNNLEEERVIFKNLALK